MASYRHCLCLFYVRLLLLLSLVFFSRYLAATRFSKRIPLTTYRKVVFKTRPQGWISRVVRECKRSKRMLSVGVKYSTHDVNVTVINSSILSRLSFVATICCILKIKFMLHLHVNAPSITSGGFKWGMVGSAAPISLFGLSNFFQ